MIYSYATYDYYSGVKSYDDLYLNRSLSKQLNLEYEDGSKEYIDLYDEETQKLRSYDATINKNIASISLVVENEDGTETILSGVDVDHVDRPAMPWLPLLLDGK